MRMGGGGWWRMFVSDFYLKNTLNKDYGYPYTLLKKWFK